MPQAPSPTTIAHFDRDDIPIPTAADTIMEILSLGQPKADTEMWAMSKTLGRNHTLGRIKAARARLVRSGTIMPAAGHALIPAGNGRCATRYILVA